MRFATFLSPEMHEVYEAIVDHVGEVVGRPASLHVGRDIGEFAAGEADFGFI